MHFHILCISLHAKIYFWRYISRKCLFEHIKSLQYCKLTSRRRRRCVSLCVLTSPLTSAAYTWPVHCKCTLKQKQRQIFFGGSNLCFSRQGRSHRQTSAGRQSTSKRKSPGSGDSTKTSFCLLPWFWWAEKWWEILVRERCAGRNSKKSG